jgi:predicted 3-demethylubiquinone-9 3-methyltransferase (glyoxalase superfamily)
MVVMFDLNGQKFMGLNGGPQYKLTEGVSFVVECNSQEEIDYYWGKLTEGGEESMCGWLKDKFGLSWQIVPAILAKLMSDQERAPRVVQTFLKMKKFDIKKLEEA